MMMASLVLTYDVRLMYKVCGLIAAVDPIDFGSHEEKCRQL